MLESKLYQKIRSKNQTPRSDSPTHADETRSFLLQSPARRDGVPHSIHGGRSARPIMTTISERNATTIPWGAEGSLELELPDSWTDVDLFWPDRSGTIDNYPAALAHALDHPLGIDPIEQLLKPQSTVAIVVDDPSRWTPVREALPILLKRIHALGITRENITINVGVGRHHAVDDASMRKRVGDAIVDNYRCLSPPVDDLSQYEDLGTTASGVPVRVFRPVAKADVKILIGSVLPHLQAGFGGGYKLIFPGTSHRSTLGALHRSGLGGTSDDAARLLGGDPAKNPMRKAIREAAALLPGECVSISHLLGPPGEVFRVLAGRPDPVLEELTTEARRRFAAPFTKPVDIIIAGNNPWPGDPMQSFKVLLQHRAAGKPGGILVGFFWTDPVELDRSFPVAAMRLIAVTGSLGGAVTRKGLVVAERAAAALGRPGTFLLRWARELVVNRSVYVYAPTLHARFGSRLGPIRLYGEQTRLWADISKKIGRESAPSVRVFPQGGLSYHPERDA